MIAAGEENFLLNIFITVNQKTGEEEIFFITAAAHRQLNVNIR